MITCWEERNAKATVLQVILKKSELIDYAICEEIQCPVFCLRRRSCREDVAMSRAY